MSADNSVGSMSDEGKLILWLREQESLESLVIEKSDLVLLNRMISDYENAISWGTDCVRCADDMDLAIGEYQRGYKAGIASVSDG